MTIDEIKSYFNNGGKYTWALYFFTINKKAKNPYKVFKIKMRDVSLITNYANNLLNCVSNYQLSKITSVEDYNGQNTNLTCDRLSLKNNLIKEAWDNLASQVFEQTVFEMKNKIKGYMVVGQPKQEDIPCFSLFKVANPIFKVGDKKSVVFKKNNDELDPFTDDLYRLNLTVDFFVIADNLYTFNYKFEDIFNLEKTLQKLKCDAVNNILKLDCFEKDDFKEYLTSYSHPKTFITLSEERLNRLKNINERKNIASILHIDLNSDNKFTNLTPEKSLLLIKYLCYKILKDGESGNLFEVSQAVKLDI